MILEFGSWRFEVDLDATQAHTQSNAQDHCECAYCRNYYQAVSACYPEIVAFLDVFGVDFNGPSELMPFEPTLILACYRVQGRVLEWGREDLSTEDVLVAVEASENGSFLLWIGELAVPWLQEEPMEDVLSPANLPEFMERMQEVWFLRHGEELFIS